ncbi:MAG TPA: hypothetical protein PLX58_08910, partial [Smithellaceae bacterium]|nr:hypothetical protein [Smithellaceae bacterium]HQF85078.1 hypothetical protein [Smithellaceae bacterium]HQG81252.1 hypothetical protein [Smithellaceae bacterium]
MRYKRRLTSLASSIKPLQASACLDDFVSSLIIFRFYFCDYFAIVYTPSPCGLCFGPVTTKKMWDRGLFPKFFKEFYVISYPKTKEGSLWKSKKFICCKQKMEKVAKQKSIK